MLQHTFLYICIILEGIFQKKIN